MYLSIPEKMNNCFECVAMIYDITEVLQIIFLKVLKAESVESLIPFHTQKTRNHIDFESQSIITLNE